MQELFRVNPKQVILFLLLLNQIHPTEGCNRLNLPELQKMLPEKISRILMMNLLRLAETQILTSKAVERVLKEDPYVVEDFLIDYEMTSAEFENLCDSQEYEYWKELSKTIQPSPGAGKLMVPIVAFKIPKWRVENADSLTPTINHLMGASYMKLVGLRELTIFEFYCSAPRFSKLLSARMLHTHPFSYIDKYKHKGSEKQRVSECIFSAEKGKVIQASPPYNYRIPADSTYLLGVPIIA